MIQSMSSKRRIRRRTCDGKKVYQSVQDARYAAHLATERVGHKIVAYKCDFCRQWHIGHPPNAIQRSLGYL